VFDWTDFLDLAEDLAARRDNESAGRSAISRAYYAAFHAGRAYLDQVNIPLDRSGRAHEQGRHVLQAADPELSQDLQRLHEWRKEADDEDPCSFAVADQAIDIVALARAIVERIRELS
jgi:uncharacterized protein (UPF0332 family)